MYRRDQGDYLRIITDLLGDSASEGSRVEVNPNEPLIFKNGQWNTDIRPSSQQLESEPRRQRTMIYLNDNET